MKSLKHLALFIILLGVAATLAWMVATSRPVAADAPLATAGTGRIYEEHAAADPDYYLVKLSEPALASYAGGVADLAPTMPGALGQTRLDPSSPAGRRYLAYLEARQQAVIAQIERDFLGQSADVPHRYRHVFNGFAIWLTPDQARSVARLPGVNALWRQFYRQPTTDVGPGLIGAPGIWDGSYTGGLPATRGEGVLVGVIDTGINIDHSSFAAIGPIDGHVHSNPFGSGVYRGWCDPAHPAYDPTLVCNDKLVGVYSYPGSGSNPIDDNGHGSHTAATAAGNIVTGTVGTLDRRISGVAPHANLISYDVCDPAIGCVGSAILAAIDDAVADGVDVINYSIGGGSRDPWQDASALAFLDAYNAGVLPVTSNGNAGPDAFTVGSPADAPWMMSVGASNHGRVFRRTLDIFGSNTGGGPFFGLETDWAVETTIPSPITAELVYAGDVDPLNIEGCTPWTGTPFSGKVALISRGTCTFMQKADNAQAGGALAMIVYNNVSGLLTNWTIGAATLPSVSLSDTDGAAAISYIQANPPGTIMTTIHPNVMAIIVPGAVDSMAGFSSRGPNPQMDVIKPDLAAPGVNVLAADRDGIEYGLKSGTSMASPHAAGSAALLRALYPGWTPAQVRSALMLTAETAVTKEDWSTPADPFDRGAGRVDLSVAALTGLVMDVDGAAYLAADPAGGGDPSALNLPSLEARRCVLSCSWTRTVQNPTGGSQSWTASLDLPAGVNGTVSPAAFSLGAGASQTITITLDVSGVPANPAPELAYLFGELVLSGVTESGVNPPEAHLPIAFNPAASTLPDRVRILTQADAGAFQIENVEAVTITNFVTDTFGLVAPNYSYVAIPQDPTNGNPYDNLSQVFFTTISVPPGATRLVAEILASQSPDLDLYWGRDLDSDNQPDADEQLGVSAGGSWNEYLTLSAPAAGTYWVLVQNWASSPSPPDAVTLAVALVLGDQANMQIAGPASWPPATPFDVTISWNVPLTTGGGGHWYGAFALGPDTGQAGDLGYVEVDLHYAGRIYNPLAVKR